MNEDWRTYTFPGIYAIRHSDSQKIYVGQAQNIASRIDNHRYSNNKCVYLRNAIHKYGWQAFEVLLLERVSDLGSLNDREQHWLDTLQSYNPENGYNICTIAASTRGVKRSAETRKKISDGLVGKTFTDERKAKIAAVHLGKPLTDEHKAKLRDAHLGKPFTDEHKAHLFGRKVSEETRAKIGQAQKGLKRSEESKAKMRAAHSNLSPEIRANMSAAARKKAPPSAETKAKIGAAFAGKHLSEEHKAKLRAARLGKKHSEESLAKMRTPRSEESRANMRIGWEKRRLTPAFEETRAKQSVAQKARWQKVKEKMPA